MLDQRDTHESKKSFSRKLRAAMNIGLPLVGSQIILSVVLFTQALPGLALVMLGILMVEVGIFQLAPRLLPDDRKYHALRASTNQFLYLVRQLNTAAQTMKACATSENRQVVEELEAAMHRQVERMVAVAVKENKEGRTTIVSEPVEAELSATVR